MSNHRDDYEVVFVWNRSSEKMADVIPQHLVLSDLTAATATNPDLIVEVAHPSVVAEHGASFLKISDFMVNISTQNLYKVNNPERASYLFVVVRWDHPQHWRRRRWRGDWWKRLVTRRGVTDSTSPPEHSGGPRTSRKWPTGEP